MLTRYHACDHCGKKLDEMHDFTDCTIDVCYNYVNADLCAGCVEKLTSIVGDFVKGGEGE